MSTVLLEGRQGPVVVQFHAPWCGPCKAVSPLVDELEKEFQGQVEVVRVDVDSSGDLAREAGVRGVPTLVAYRDGKEIRRHGGTLDRNGLRTLFQSAMGNTQAVAAPLGTPAWHRFAKIGAALALLLTANQFPSMDWLRWVGFGVMFWAMRDLCPSCRSA